MSADRRPLTTEIMIIVIIGAQWGDEGKGKVVDLLADRFDAGTVVTPELLRERGLIHSERQPIKVLARGDMSKKLTVRAHKFSGKAAEKIAAAGGAAEVIAAASK